MRRCAPKVCTSVTTSSKDCVVCSESVQSTVFLVVGNDTLAFTILHDQVKSEIFDKVVGVMSERLAI